MFADHTNSAFHPIIQRIERDARFASDDADDTKLDKLERLLAESGEPVDEVAPFIAMLLSLPWVDRYGERDLNPQMIRERTLDALVSYVLALSRQRPVLFIVEDMHWVDPSTEALLDALVDRLSDSSIFVVITHRPGYQSPWRDETNHLVVALNRLSRAQCAEIVRRIGGRSISDSMTDGIVARADGMPLFVEELTRTVLASSEASASSSIATPAGIPESLQDSLMERLDRLGAAKEIAQIGSTNRSRLLVCDRRGRCHACQRPFCNSNFVTSSSPGSSSSDTSRRICTTAFDTRWFKRQRTPACC